MAGFGANDLRGLLGGENEPSTSSGLGARAFQPRVDATKKVSRLRAGVTPKWAAGAGDEAESAAAAAAIVVAGTGAGSVSARGGEEEYEEIVEVVIDRSRSSGRPQASEAPARVAASAVVDRRLRLAVASSAAAGSAGGEGGGDVAPRRRRIYEAEVIVEASTSSALPKPVDAPLPAAHTDEELSAADALAARRARARLAEQEREHTVAASWERRPSAAQKGSVTALASSSGSESSEYETDTDDDDGEEEEAVQNAPRPVFVPRAQREAAFAAKAAEEEHQQERERARKKQQQQISRQMVAEGLKRADAVVVQEDNEEDFGLPDDTDGVDPEAEYEEWELRELTRLQIGVERRKELTAEAEELLRRRQRTDQEVEQELKEERAAEAAAGTALSKKPSHTKTGVFYIDESSVAAGDVRLRDTSVQASRRGAEDLRKFAAVTTTHLLGTAGGRRVAKGEEEEHVSS